MSSVVAAYSQVPVRAKYLQARAATYQYAPSATNLPTAISKTAVTAASLAASTPQAVYVAAGEVFSSVVQGAANTMYLDKGKRVTLVDTAGKHMATFALVVQYAGTGADSTNQGNGATAGQIYVQVWDAFNPASVTVVAGPA